MNKMKKLGCKNIKLFIFGVLCICTCITLLNYTWCIKNIQKILHSHKSSSMIDDDHHPKELHRYNFKIELKMKLGCHDRPLIVEKLQYGDYWLLRNYIRGHRSIRMGCAESITYATNGDYTFFANIANVVVR